MELVWNICQISGLYSTIVSSIKRFSTKCCWSHILTLHLVVLSQSLEAGVQGCQIALVATTSTAVGGQEAAQPAFQPVALALTSLMPIPEKCHHSHMFWVQAVCIPTRAGTLYYYNNNNTSPWMYSISARTWIISWSSEQIPSYWTIVVVGRRTIKHLHEWDVYLLWCAQDSAGRRPCHAKMPLHYEAPEPGAARADPVTGGNRILVRVFLVSRQAEADGTGVWNVTFFCC